MATTEDSTQPAAIGKATVRSNEAAGKSAAGNAVKSESSHSTPRRVAAAAIPVHQTVFASILLQRKSASRNTMIGQVIATVSDQQASGSFSTSGSAQRVGGVVATIAPASGAIQTTQHPAGTKTTLNIKSAGTR